MTLKMSDTEKRAGIGSADGLDRQPFAWRPEPAEAAKAACALPLAVGSDARTPS